MMTTDPHLNAALDRFTVPPPSADLAARIIAAAETRDTPVQAATARRRDRRGAWVRARNLVLGTAALGLMSATAAASGLFGGGRIHIPVISTIVAAAIPEQKKPSPPKPAPKLAKTETPKPAPKPAETEPVPEVTVPELPPAEAILGTPEARRALHATKVAERMEERLSRVEVKRGAMGKPAQTERRRALLEQLKAAKTDEERRAALLAIKSDNARLLEQRAARMGVDPAVIEERRAANAKLTPEQRMERISQLRAKRRARMEELRKLKDVDPADLRARENAPPPETIPPETIPPKVAE